MLSRWRSFLIAALTVIGFVALSRSARAQQVTILNKQSLVRLDKDNQPTNKRQPGWNPEGVSYQDCVDDQRIQFSLQMSGYVTNAAVEAWASIAQDCGPATQRAGATQQCWRVYNAGIPLQPNATINIPVRALMSGATSDGPTKPLESSDVCGKVNLSNITVQFLYFDPGNPQLGKPVDSATIPVDTVGPSPPSGLRTKPGNTRIMVEWDQISGGTSTDGGTSTGGGLTDLLGVQIFCDLAQTTSTNQCSSPNFVNSSGAAIVPAGEFRTKYLCGEIYGTSGNAITATSFGGKPLENDTSYAVAVAGTDSFGNVGSLSGALCEMPELTTDFWDDYRNAGGRAGDGCSASPNASAGSMFTVAAGLGLALSTILRNRRRARAQKANVL